MRPRGTASGPAGRRRREDAFRAVVGAAHGTDARRHHLQPQQPQRDVLRVWQQAHHRRADGADEGAAQRVRPLRGPRHRQPRDARPARGRVWRRDALRQPERHQAHVVDGILPRRGSPTVLELMVVPVPQRGRRAVAPRPSGARVQPQCRRVCRRDGAPVVRLLARAPRPGHEVERRGREDSVQRHADPRPLGRQLPRERRGRRHAHTQRRVLRPPGDVGLLGRRPQAAHPHSGPLEL